MNCWCILLIHLATQMDMAQCSSAEAARGSWLAVVSGVQSTDSGGLGLPPPSTADGYLPMTAYNTTAES